MRTLGNRASTDRTELFAIFTLVRAVHALFMWIHGQGVPTMIHVSMDGVWRKLRALT
ncbi:hypothetical protein BD289DRAFT_435303 [Coniella lustricola]|uniref:Uncharacterized protein n=1 Tax=Coniella lustricola TaxID=2025994 RepID=A0A2T3A6J9_9PEZI|nr:hypothetical protein BD289DRAFT_435303 [Coniella lustricola]